MDAFEIVKRAVGCRFLLRYCLADIDRGLKPCQLSHGAAGDKRARRFFRRDVVFAFAGGGSGRGGLVVGRVIRTNLNAAPVFAALLHSVAV